MLPPTYDKETQQYRFQSYYVSSGRHFTVVHNPNYDANNPYSQQYEYYLMQFIITAYNISYIMHQVVFERDNND